MREQTVGKIKLSTGSELWHVFKLNDERPEAGQCLTEAASFLKERPA